MGDVLLRIAERKDCYVCRAVLFLTRFVITWANTRYFSSSGRRNTALIFKEGTCILEKRVEIIGAKNS